MIKGTLRVKIGVVSKKPVEFLRCFVLVNHGYVITCYKGKHSQSSGLREMKCIKESKNGSSSGKGYGHCFLR